MASSVADLPPPLSFICIIAVLIVYVICCYMIMDFLSQDEDDLTPFDQDSSQTPDHTSYSHFSVEELQEITCLYRGAGASCSVCAICLENLQHAEVCRVLPACHHEFHAQCIDPWLSKRLNCPICRAPFRFRQSFRR
ncbi:E3 ubiquitin-protein ligase [Sesamum angolense]|uniref:E3 ubiquitin-protein ligase n=1 Tax=Sesamum angolense TaxID=2727404 RepID=A0AAE1WC72_9LAMI|nr:E3 ubiquitin-protein ligase [Sesamum angolense]